MATQKLLADLIVTLGPGASVTLHHDLHDELSRGLTPDFVIPDRNTPIGVVTANTQTITFTNPDLETATAQFHVENRHSIIEGDKPPLWWKGGTGGSGSGDVDIYVNAINGNDANPGSAALPVQTFGRGMELLLGTGVDTGRRTMHLANSVLAPNTQVTYPAANTGSFDTAGIFAWGKAGPLGMNALPFYIESSFVDLASALTPTSVVGNVVSVPYPTALTLDQLKGCFLTDGAGRRWTIIGNTVTVNPGDSADILLLGNPGEVFPSISGTVSVQIPGAVVELPDEGEWTLQEIAIAIQGVDFVLGPSAGATFSFRNTRLWTQGLRFLMPNGGTLTLSKDTIFEANAGSVADVWALDPNSPFNPDSPGGIIILSTGGVTSIGDGCHINGPVLQDGGTYAVARDGHCSLHPAWLNTLDELDISGEFVVRPLGTFRSAVNATVVSADRDDTTVRQCDWGGTGYASTTGLGRFFDVKNLAGSPLTSAYAVAVNFSGQVQVDAATIANNFYGTAGAGGPVSLGGVATAYGALPASDVSLNAALSIP